MGIRMGAEACDNMCRATPPSIISRTRLCP
jgi:hypothetical protein